MNVLKSASVLIVIGSAPSAEARKRLTAKVVLNIILSTLFLFLLLLYFVNEFINIFFYFILYIFFIILLKRRRKGKKAELNIYMDVFVFI